MVYELGYDGLVYESKLYFSSSSYIIISQNFICHPFDTYLWVKTLFVTLHGIVLFSKDHEFSNVS